MSISFENYIGKGPNKAVIGSLDGAKFVLPLLSPLVVDKVVFQKYLGATGQYIATFSTILVMEFFAGLIDIEKSKEIKINSITEALCSAVGYNNDYIYDMPLQFSEFGLILLTKYLLSDNNPEEIDPIDDGSELTSEFSVSE